MNESGFFWLDVIPFGFGLFFRKASARALHGRILLLIRHDMMATAFVLQREHCGRSWIASLHLWEQERRFGLDI